MEPSEKGNEGRPRRRASPSSRSLALARPISMPKRGRHAGGSSFERNGADSNRGGRNNGWLDFQNTPMGVEAFIFW